MVFECVIVNNLYPTIGSMGPTLANISKVINRQNKARQGLEPP